MGDSVKVISLWERSGRLLGTALKLRTENKRSPEEWADHLQGFVPGQPVDPDDPWLRGETLLGACLEKAHRDGLHEEWAGHLHGFVFDPRSGKFIRVNYADKRWGSIDRPSYYYIDSAMRIEHLPIRGQGVTDVTGDLLPDFQYEPTTQQVLDTIEASGRRFDRAEAETYLDNLDDSVKAELDKRPVVAFCGPWVRIFGHGCVPCVIASADGRRLDFRRVGPQWPRRYRFAFAHNL